MPDKRISIELHVDEDLGGLKQVQSALDQFARSGGAAVGKLEGRVLGLQRATGQLAAQFSAHLPDALSKFLVRLPSFEQALGRLGGALANILFGRPPAEAFVTPPFNPNPLLGFAVPSGSGPASAAAGAAGIPAGGGLLDFLRRIPLRGLGPLSGDQVLRLGLALGEFGGSGRGAIFRTTTGAIGGALAGLALGGQSGAFAGPAGVAAGAIIGGLLGFLGSGRGKRKEQASEIADRGFAEIRRVFDDYQNFRRDYGPALAAINNVWRQMVQGWQRLGGGVGERSIRDQQRYFEQILEQMRVIEEARGIRGNVLRSLPVPSFQHGGFASTGGFALLHPGEFVLSSRAVERLGMSLLQGLNVGRTQGSAPTGGLVIEPASAAFLEDAFRRDPAAADRGLMVVVRAGGKFSRALRG